MLVSWGQRHFVAKAFAISGLIPSLIPTLSRYPMTIAVAETAIFSLRKLTDKEHMATNGILICEND